MLGCKGCAKLIPLYSVNKPLSCLTMLCRASTAAINAAIAPDSVANINADTGAYIWLKDNSAANVAVSPLPCSYPFLQNLGSSGRCNITVSDILM